MVVAPEIGLPLCSLGNRRVSSASISSIPHPHPFQPQPVPSFFLAGQVYVPDVYCVVLTFVETPLFARLVTTYLSDEEYGKLQEALHDDPEAGEIIPGSGGVRKVRWALPGAGNEADCA